MLNFSLGGVCRLKSIINKLSFATKISFVQICFRLGPFSGFVYWTINNVCTYTFKAGVVYHFVFCFFHFLRKPIPVCCCCPLHGCTCLTQVVHVWILDVLMSPDIGRNNLFLLIIDVVHTVGFKQRLNWTSFLKVMSVLLCVL